MKKIKGAYALVVSSPRKLIGARDPYGFKPLCIGKRCLLYTSGTWSGNGKGGFAGGAWTCPNRNDHDYSNSRNGVCESSCRPGYFLR